jgi:hypothetical protein
VSIKSGIDSRLLQKETDISHITVGIRRSGVTIIPKAQAKTGT